MLHWTASIPGKVTTSSAQVGQYSKTNPCVRVLQRGIISPTSQGMDQSGVRHMLMRGGRKPPCVRYLPTCYATERRLLGGTVLPSGDGLSPQAGSPATITNLVRVDEVIRRLAAFGTFERYRPSHSANIQTMCTGAQLNPLPELRCRVPLVQFARLLACEEKRPGTKEDHQRCSYYDRHNQ